MAAYVKVANVDDLQPGALVHGSELRDRSPVPREGVTPLGNCRACRAGSSC